MAESEAIVVHEDALDAVCQVASRSIDQLIWQAPHGVAKAVTLLGAGVVVLPMLGRVSGIGARDSLQYSAHPQRALGGLMDRLDLELKFGALDPEKLIQELSIGRAALEKRLESLNDDDLREEVHALQDWREKAMGRLKTLEKRAAWAFLGVAGEGHVSQVEIKKAFKRRALELHPDKGGDAERFRLLQEMRDLLVEPKRHELEGGQEAKKEPAKKLEKGEEEAEDEEEDFSDDSWDADEEFRKMFPKRKKKQKRQEDAEPEVLKDQDFHRGRFEAARRKLQRQLRELWARAGRLAEEIDRSRCQPGAQEALRQLRRFVDRFEATEVKRLREDDPKKALRIFRRFLEQGSEVLCAAGALDPGATVSVVAMQVNCPLLQMACSEELQRRCAQLLEAIQELPEMGAVDLEDGLVYELLLPEEGEVPGTRLLQVQLPPEATLGDLRRAALRCGGFGGVVPRIFSGGRFVAGHDATPLTNLELATVLHCLPSNLVSRKAVEKQKRPSPKEVRQEVREEEVKEKPKDVEKSLEVKLLEEKSTQSSEKLQDVREENKENEDAWFDDFFAQGEKEKEEARRVQERGKNAMEARLKAQKQAQEAKKKLEERKLKAPSGKAAAFAAPASPEATAARLQTACTALVESKEEPSTELQKSRDTWDASWSHPCAGAKRSDGSAIFCGPCDSWVALGSRYDHRDFEIHCEKVGHFGWID